MMQIKMEDSENRKKSAKANYQKLKGLGLSKDIESQILKELEIDYIPDNKHECMGLYDITDLNSLPGFYPLHNSPVTNLKTLDELLDKDKKREEDGFPRRIRIGKYIKPSQDNKGQIIIVPTTTEPKFYHDDSVTEEEETGGSGEGEEGEVIGEQQAQPQEGEGEGQGAGEGGGASHDVSTDAFDLGKILTEKFELPNLKNKGKKKSFTKYVYDLTDRNRGFGQFLEKKETLKKVIQTNILLGNIDGETEFDPSKIIISPKDHVYRILSKEKDFESQAIVFFIRDYSGSMQGAPAEVISKQHLFIYSWLMYQYQNNVLSRFILHDTEAKEVPDFHTYYSSQVAGGTKVAPAFQLVRKIVEEERLYIDYNIYIFYGTDGDDWEENGKDMLEALRGLLVHTNRAGITVARNSWASGAETTVEKYLKSSGLLKEKADLLRLDAFKADEANEERIIESIKNLTN